MAILYLVRHGQAEAEDTEDPGLSAIGREQTTQLAARLRSLEPAEIWHSPQRRAVETAQLLAADLDISTTESALLRDRTPFPDKGEWPQYPAKYHDWLRNTPQDERDPGGRAIDGAIQHFSNSKTPTVLITHAFVIGWFVRDALDAPAWRWLGLQPANCGLSIISYGKEKRLQAFNQQ